VVTALAAFKTRDSGGMLVRRFWQVWPWLLAIPVALLFLGILKRTDAYGMTESRYLVLLAGVWLAAVVLTQGVFRARFDIRYIPAIIAGLLITASFGPWGASGWSQRSQMRDLVQRLTAAGMMEGGRITASSPNAKPLVEPDKARVFGAINYFQHRGRLDQLKPLFAGVSGDPFAVSTDHPWKRAELIKSRFGLPNTYNPPAVRQVENHSFHYNTTGKPFVVRHGNLRVTSAISLREKSTISLRDEAGSALSVTLNDTAITLVDGATSKTVRFDLMANPGIKEALAVSQRDHNAPHFELKSTSGDFEAKLMLTTFVGQKQPGVKFAYVVFWLLIADPPH
jgi:Domain of unknown function (DUF4153)